MSTDWLEKYSILRYVWKGELEIFYSPIARKYVVATNEQFVSFIKDGAYADVFAPLADYIPIHQQPKVQTPEDYTLLTVLPNNVCNFSCSYCYSAKGRNGSYLKESHLKAAIDFFIDSKPDGFSRPLTISYMGGGEPMLSWSLVSNSIMYAKERAKLRGFRLNYRIITNGSIIDASSLMFLKEQNIDVSVSFELIREIQDLQRKNYDKVDNNIRNLINNGINIQINSTITPANVGRMVEMFDCLIQEYSRVRNVMFEPVTGQQLFQTTNDMKHFYELYTDQFIQCLRRADKENISLTSFAFLRTIFPLERACPGELCITADGQITGCYCISSPNEPLFEQARYGWIDKEGKIQFDLQKYKELKSHDVYERTECLTCKVKWNCGGGCFYQYSSYDDVYREEVCNFTRSFVAQIIKYKVEQRVKGKENYPLLLKE